MSYEPQVFCHGNGAISEFSLKLLCAAGVRADRQGPAGAFVVGKESETRQQLFGRIAPVYDQASMVETHRRAMS